MLHLGMGTPGPRKGWQGFRISRLTLSPTCHLQLDTPNPLPRMWSYVRAWVPNRPQGTPELSQGAPGMEVPVGVWQCLPGIGPFPHHFSLPEFLACTEAAAGLAGKRDRKRGSPAPHNLNAPIWPFLMQAPLANGAGQVPAPEPNAGGCLAVFFLLLWPERAKLEFAAAPIPILRCSHP